MYLILGSLDSALSISFQVEFDTRKAQQNVYTDPILKNTFDLENYEDPVKFVIQLETLVIENVFLYRCLLLPMVKIISKDENNSIIHA